MKVIPEYIQVMNLLLKESFGIHDNALPKFRIAWSDDQFEYRFGEYDKFTEHGVWHGKEKGFKYVPKYRQWLPSQWVLERLLPTAGNDELTEKLSYEPFFPFKGLPPDWDVCKFIIENTLEKENAPKSGVAKYKIPEEELQTPEARAERILKIEKYLAADESDLQARLRFREAVVHPGLPAPLESKDSVQ